MANHPPDRIIGPDDLAELTTALLALQKAQRRYNAVSFRIADEYDIGPDEAVDPASGRVVPAPQAGRG